MLSLALLAASGMFDTVSVVVRSTLLQVLTPDHLLGRVSSVNAIFIGSSNEIGAFESGLAARLLGTVPSVVLGGLATLGVVAVGRVRDAGAAPAPGDPSVDRQVRPGAREGDPPIGCKPILQPLPADPRAQRQTRTACGALSLPTTNSSDGLTITPRARACATNPSVRHGSGRGSQK